MPDVAIETQTLTKTFGRGAKSLHAVKSLDLKVERGEVFGFLGPNGAGKTSTIRMLTGISRATSGRALVGGEEISPDRQDAKGRIGYMPEMPGFYPAMKAIDHLAFWASFHKIPRGEARARGQELMSRVGLGDATNRKAKEFSHGMKKRLALAGALIHDPDVLILDEPSGGLDPEGTIFFRNLIEEQKRKGKTVFLSSHLLPEVQLICTRIAVLNRGELVAVDRVEELSKKVTASAPVRVHVNCPPLSEEQKKSVAAMAGVTGVEEHAAGILVVANPGTPLGYPLNKALLEAGVQVEAIYPIIPSLEEVFVKLLQQQKGGGAA